MKKYILILILWLSLSPGAFAITYVAYLNGITNTTDNANESLATLCDALKSFEPLARSKEQCADKEGNVRYVRMYNPTAGFTTDNVELAWQSLISDHILGKVSKLHPKLTRRELASSEDYKYYLGNFYAFYIEKLKQNGAFRYITDAKSKEAAQGIVIFELVDTFADKLISKAMQGDKVIVVAHSQGNFFAEAIASVIKVRHSAALKNIRFVGVASVAASSPNNRWVSSNNDAAVFVAMPANYEASKRLVTQVQELIGEKDFDLHGMYAPLQSNVECDSFEFPLHNFVSVYMNGDVKDRLSGAPVRSIIVDLIKQSYTALQITEPYAIELSQSSVSILNGTIDPTVDFIEGRNGGKAAKFYGVDKPGKIRIPNNEAMQFTNGATFDMWVRLDSNKGMSGYGGTSDSLWAMALLAKSHDRSGVALNTHTPDSNYSGNGYGFSTFSTYDSTWSCQDGTILNRNPGKQLQEWYRVTAVASSSEGLAVYLNQELVYTCTRTLPNFHSMNTQDLYIGMYSDYWYPLDGAIQDIKIYKQALTPTEVKALE